MNKTGSDEYPAKSTRHFQASNCQMAFRRKYYTMRHKFIQGIAGITVNKETGKEGKKMSIIEELYLGNICPDSGTYKDNSPVVQAIKRKGKYLDELMEKMDDDEKELLNKYCDAQADINEIVQYDTFTYALKFGVLLMTEIFMGMDIFGNREEKSDEIHFA